MCRGEVLPTASHFYRWLAQFPGLSFRHGETCSISLPSVWVKGNAEKT